MYIYIYNVYIYIYNVYIYICIYIYVYIYTMVYCQFWYTWVWLSSGWEPMQHGQPAQFDDACYQRGQVCGEKTWKTSDTWGIISNSDLILGNHFLKWWGLWWIHVNTMNTHKLFSSFQFSLVTFEPSPGIHRIRGDIIPNILVDRWGFFLASGNAKKRRCPERNHGCSLNETTLMTCRLSRTTQIEISLPKRVLTNYHWS